MTTTFKHDAPVTDNRLDGMQQGVIGKPISRYEGLAKVTGTAPYTADYAVDGCLEGVLVTATITKGNVKSFDTEAALALDGVVALIDDQRLIARAAQGTAGEAPMQPARKISYFGQPIALIVAETFEQARDAAKHVIVEYEIDEDAPLDPETAGFKPKDDGTDQGDLTKAMADAAYSVDATFTTMGHASAAMEPHTALAQWDSKKLTVHASLQMLNYNIAELADALDLKESDIRLLSPFVGGGFGSKLGLSEETVAASIAAMTLNRPVRVVMTRQQVFQSIMRRSETRQRLRLSADEDGHLTGFGHEAWVSNLPDEDYAEPVLQSSHFLYSGENRYLQLNVAGVHQMTAGSVRAPGEAVGMPVLEAAMDMLAEKAGLDPVEFRLRNIPEKHPAKGIPFSSNTLAECLTTGAKAFGWKSGPQKPRQRLEGDYWIGTGVASAARVHNVGEAKVRVSLNADGNALVQTDMTDIGTGTYTILSQIVGEALGLSTDRITVELGDTDFPRGPGSGGSWGAASIGSAAYLACQGLRKKLAKAAGVEETELNLKDGEAVDGKSIGDLMDAKIWTVEGHYIPGKVEDDYLASGFGAFFAEVRVNRHTGETRVSRMVGAFGFGRVLNTKTARSQCIGGMTWSVGAALTEALFFDPNDGHLVNGDLAEYHVPVHRDIPHCDVVFVEERDGIGSLIQSKGIGELGMCGGAGAIANAIYNACGARVFDFPMTPYRVLTAMPK